MFLYQDRIVSGIWVVVLGGMFTCYGLFFKATLLPAKISRSGKVSCRDGRASYSMSDLGSFF